MSVPDLLEAIDRHADEGVSEAALTAARQRFSYLGQATVSFLVPEVVKQAVAAEVNSLLDTAGVRRDLQFVETDDTPRRMRNVRRQEVASEGSVIKEIYRSRALLDLLAAVVNEPVHPCPYEPEQYVITGLEKEGDTHGWHWDDYAFALVWVVDCPPVEDGGFVQWVPGTTWNKQEPSISRAFTSRPIYSAALSPGDLYLMRTDTSLHRVYPLRDGRRRILNMGFASTADLGRDLTHETMDKLWDGPAERPVAEPVGGPVSR